MPIDSGLGIAPLVALAQNVVMTGKADGRPAPLIRRVHDGVGLPLQADLDHLVSLGALRVVDLVGPRSTTGTAWLPQQLGHVPGPQAARRLVGDLDGCDVFVCGAAPWAEAVAADLRTAGLPPTPEATVESVTATCTGATASTRFGDVQVQITVTDGVITAADAIAYPTRDHQSQQINSWAVPALDDEVLAAQSASIDMLSHATVTSRAYIASLQDALNQAGI